MKRLLLVALLVIVGCGTAPQPTPIPLPLVPSPRKIIFEATFLQTLNRQFN